VLGSLDKPRIALLKTHVWPRASTDLVSAWEKIRQAFVGRDIIPTELELPSSFSSHTDYNKVIRTYEARSSFLGYYKTFPDHLDPTIVAMVETAGSITPADLQRSYDGCAELRRLWDAVAAQYDVIVTPSVVGEAPLGLQLTGDECFCSLWTMLHAPAINVPGLVGEGQLPLGISVVGARWSDEKVLESAMFLSQILGSD